MRIQALGDLMRLGHRTIMQVDENRPDGPMDANYTRIVLNNSGHEFQKQLKKSFSPSTYKIYSKGGIATRIMHEFLSKGDRGHHVLNEP
jgi:hypothetical protein